MNEFILKKESLDNDIKNIGIFLFVIAAIQTAMAVWVDSFILVDAMLVFGMACFAYFKQSRWAVYCAFGYYVFMTCIDFTELPVLGIAIRGAILYWLGATAWDAINLNKAEYAEEVA